MSDKLIAIKIKQQDGSWMGPIPISVVADNVIYSEKEHLTLTDVLGEVDITKGTIQQQIDECISASLIASTDEARSYLNLSNGSTDGQGNSTNVGLSEEVKTALLNCFSNVAWANENGLEYYTALRNALYPQQSG